MYNPCPDTVPLEANLVLTESDYTTSPASPVKRVVGGQGVRDGLLCTYSTTLLLEGSLYL